MAEILRYRIQFLDDNPYGDFIAGDTVDVYYDDSSTPPGFPNVAHTGIVVKKNGVQIFSGADILISSTAYKTEQDFTTLLCYGTKGVLVTRQDSFPYAWYAAWVDVPGCSLNGPVCDLQIVGTPVIKAASESVNDGSITVVASSSNSPIEYKLNSDFVYGDGTAQSTGEFSELPVGQYRIYVRDSANCATNILVTVPLSDAYAAIYRLEYDDLVGGVTRVDVLQRGYGGQVYEVKGTNIGFERSLKGEGSNNPFEAILATKATLYLTSETDFAFSTIYTNNPERFRIAYYKLTDKAGLTPLNDLPALSTWSTTNDDENEPNWNTGTSTPNVTLPGFGAFSFVRSEILWAAYSFEAGRTYNLTLTFTRVTNSGNSNPRTGTLKIMDSSNNTIFSQTKAVDEGVNEINISFIATENCDRIGFEYVSGMNVTITVNAISGAVDGFALWGLYKVLPQQYSEDYKAPPYYVSIVATDGLPALKDYIFLKDDGQRFNESMSAIKLIAYILKKTGLEFNIRVAINLYSTGMDTTDDDDPLDQAYVDCDVYYIATENPSLSFVLQSILESFGASIIQEFGVWHIVRVQEKVDEYDYREFDPDGNYVGNGSYNPVQDVTPKGTPGFHFSDVDHHLTMLPGYGKIRVFYKLGLRENILENGDFRLTSVYDSQLNQYYFNIDTRGFELVSPNYPIQTFWETIEEGKAAWKIDGGSPTADTGNAYIVSNTYNIRMGVANTLKISIRYKLPPPVVYGLTPIPIDIPYQKVRIRVKYGTKYLLQNGTWSDDENFITIYATDFDKYVESEFIATQPDSGAVSGYDFEIRVYHSYIFHAEFATFNDLRAKPTIDGSDPVIPVGARSEVSAFGFGERLYYYELEENTDSESEPSIIRPDDYHASNNPVQWVLKREITKTYFTNFSTPFWIDHIRVAFLTNGIAPTDTVLREVNAEKDNTAVLEKEVIHGSYMNLITTIPQWDFGIGKLTAQSGATLALITTNVLSANLLFAGYFRDDNGAGWQTWTRDGIAEQAGLHLILLQQYAAQYRKSWRRLTGSFHSQSQYFHLIDVFRIVNDNNRLYLPISPTIDDKTNRVRGEFLELIDAKSAAGSDGSIGSPFTSGFSSGFGSGYN